ncbi:MAG TPA: hypothetical protein VFD56_13420 [Chitinophagaceae bacterium]|nr:hypothetical protein [Chitinophagaceae bacterium]
MNITRHNYEEYFILYLDNELSSDDRRQVEIFVQENADLKEEFDLLLQTRLMPDDAVMFNNKQQLLKTALPGPINDSNFEEWLLLYIDDELTGRQKIAVEDFLVNHPSAKTELGLLQKTKLHSEPAVIFPNKETLYRREEKVSVIGFPWRKIAVAASLLLAISTTAYLVFNDKGSTEGKTISEKLPGTNSTKDDAADDRSNNTATIDPVVPENNEAITEGDESVNNSLAGEQKNNVSENNRNDQRSIPSAKQDTKLIAESKSTTQPTNNVASSTQNSASKNVEEKQIAMVDIPVKEELTTNRDNNPIKDVTPDNAEPLIDKTDAINEPIGLVDVDESGKKNKLRGFFRKVTRTFEKRTNIKATDDEDRLLLAGLAIKL